MLRSHRFVALASLLALAGCDPEIPITGLDLSVMFPTAGDRFWMYNHDGDADVAYMIPEGTADPAEVGEDWNVLRWYSGGEQEMIDAFAEAPDGPWDHWLFTLYAKERPEGWYLMGYEDRQGGADVGEYFDAPGVPLAMSGALTGSTWQGDTPGGTVTTTAVGEITDPLEFNGQYVTEAWHVTLESVDDPTMPLLGDWWLLQGTGFIQLDTVGLLPSDGGPWKHRHNDVVDNLLGIPN